MSWIELGIGAVWMVAAVALTLMAIIGSISNPQPEIQTGLTPPPWVTPPPGSPPPTPASAGGPAGAMTLIPLLGLVGGGPSLLAGWLLRRTYKSQSRGVGAMIVAFVSAFLFLGVIGAALVASVTQPDNGPIDADFLILGALVGVTGIVHLLAGLVVAIRGRADSARFAGMPPAAPAVHSGA